MNRQEKRKLLQQLKSKSRKFSNITTETMSFEDFMMTLRFPFNRNEALRLKKVESKLSTLLDVHCNVVIGILTEDCEHDGKKYKAGTRFILDGNTRALFWIKGLSDFVPEELYAQVIEFSDMETMKLRYYTFDSLTSVEKTAEKVAGIMIGLDMNVQSSIMKTGGIVTAINCATYGMFPKDFPDGFAKTEEKDIEKKVFLFKEEILILDKIKLDQKYSNQSLLCAFLMMLKLAILNNDGSLEEVKRIISDIGCGTATTGKSEMNGVTHIVEELKAKNSRHSYFDWKTTYNDLKRQITFVIYWMDKELKNEFGQRYQGRDSEKEYDKFHERFESKLRFTTEVPASSKDASYFVEDKFTEDVNSITPFMKDIDEEQSNENILN
jgi:hypothetical protein